MLALRRQRLAEWPTVAVTVGGWALLVWSRAGSLPEEPSLPAGIVGLVVLPAALTIPSSSPDDAPEPGLTAVQQPRVRLPAFANGVADLVLENSSCYSPMYRATILPTPSLAGMPSYP